MPRAPRRSTPSWRGCSNWPTTIFSHDLDAVHWGHVGDLGRVEKALDDLLAIFAGQPK